jgi:hypothetical protein
MDAAKWTNPIDWQTPAGQMLRRLASALPQDQRYEITVFDSAPLQVMIDPLLLSGDVDVFSDSEDLEHWVQKAGLGREQSEFHVQVCSGLNFRTSPRWGTRTQSAQVGRCTFRFPHPVDILIAKLNRLEEKDLRAFRSVISKTGHPTEIELIDELQMAVDLFRPSFDEENASDLVNNTRRLWPLIFGREIDVRKEIIAPALAKRRAGYDLPTRDYKRELKEAAHAYSA